MKALQTSLFTPVDQLLRQPLILAYGLGVDSTAVLVELRRRGIRPDAILFADTGDEKIETYRYLPVINAWLNSVEFPQVTVVKYQPVDFKDHPPYATLGENCLTNGTLPSLAFGFKSCSLKWKVAPQNKWTDNWMPARDYWAAGGKVKKIIGYDTSPKDLKRYAHVKDAQDDKYEYWYPLIEWGMDREACKQAIRDAGLPVPPKSACIFCPATQPAELMAYRKQYLRYIVLMEARAKPRLGGCMDEQQRRQDFLARQAAWQDKLSTARGRRLQKLLNKPPKALQPGSGCAGLWRSATKARPAMMTEYIARQGLLSSSEIMALQHAAQELIPQNQLRFTTDTEHYLNWHEFMEMFSAEDAIEEISCCAAGCSLKGE